MKEVSRLKSAAPSLSKLLIPWVVSAAGAVLITIMLGIGNESYGNEDNGEKVLSDQGDYTRMNLPIGAKRRLGKGVLSDMKVSPDGSRLAIASSAGIWLYDVNAKQELDRYEIALLTGHEGVVRQLVFSPDGNMFTSIGVDKTIRLWETSTGEHLFTLTTPKPTGEFRSVKFIRDGKTLAGHCSDDYKVYLWDVTTGKFIESYRPKLPMIRLGQDRDWQFAIDTFFDPIGNITFAVGNKDGTISIRDGRTGLEKIRLVGYTDESQYFNVDSEHDRLNPRKPTVRRSLVRPGDKPTIPKQLKANGTPFPIQYLLSAPSHSSPNYEKRPTKWINTLDFAPDGKTLVSTSRYLLREDSTSYSGSGGPTEIWDVETGEQLSSLSLRVSEVKFSGDGRTLAITGSGGVSVWDVALRKEIGVFNEAKKAVFSGDGKTLCIIENNRFTFWDINAHSEISTIIPFQVQGYINYLPENFVLSQYATHLATADVDGVINVWETTTPSKKRTLSRDYEKTFISLAFKHDGKTLVSGNTNGYLQSWDFNTGNRKGVSKPVKRSINGLHAHKDNTFLTVVSDSILLRLYPLETHTILNAENWSGSASLDDGTQLRVKTLSFSSNGKRLATKNKKTKMVDVWDISIGKEPNHLTEIEHRWGPVALSPDGSKLTSASNSDNGVDLWDANTGKLLTKLSLPKKLLVKYNNISSLAFSHDGKILAGGTNKKEIHLWDSNSFEHIGILKAHKHAVCALKFSPGNTILASGDTGGGICLWSISDRKLLATYDALGEGFVSELAFTPDGKTLASTSGSRNFPKTPGGTIFLWDVPSK